LVLGNHSENNDIKFHGCLAYYRAAKAWLDSNNERFFSEANLALLA